MRRVTRALVGPQSGVRRTILVELVLVMGDFNLALLALLADLVRSAFEIGGVAGIVLRLVCAGDLGVVV